MQIKLSKVGKRFLRNWIFKDVNLTLEGERVYGLVGHNGSGKSTLLQIIAGFLSPSRGEVQFEKDGLSISRNDLNSHLSFCSPYTELIEELSLEEHLDFHKKFRPFLDNKSTADIIELLDMKKERNKAIRFFSSGMKQRLKLALSILCEASIILLDEPSTNLDAKNSAWFLEILAKYKGDRLVIIASNVESDLQLCSERISVEDFK